MVDPIAAEGGRSASTDDEIDLLDLLVVIANNARLLVFGPLLVGVAALAIAFVLPPVYTAKTTMLPPQQQGGAASMLASALGGLAGLAGAAGVNVKSPADTYVSLLESRTVADALIDRFDLMTVYESKFRVNARRTLEDATTIKASKKGLIEIEVDDKDPKRAADLANGYVQELTRLSGSLAITEAQQRRAFFEKQLQQTHEALKKAESALAQVGASESLIKAAPAAVLEGVARLKAQVTMQEIRIATMRGFLTDESPQLQLAKHELDSLRSQLSQAERSQPAGETSAPAYLNNYRDFKYQETLFELLAKQYEMARLDEAREGATVQVVDPALAPERKSKPKRGLIAVIATLASGFVLLLYVLVRDSIRKNSGDPETSGKISNIRNGFRTLLRPR